MNGRNRQNCPRSHAGVFTVVVGLGHVLAQIAVFFVGLALAGGPDDIKTPILDCIACVVAFPFALLLYWLDNEFFPPLMLVAALVDSVLWGTVAWAITKRFEKR